MNSRVRKKYVYKKAQGIFEWVFLFCIAAAAILIIGHYVRNSLSGRIRETADAFGRGEVYRPFGNTTVTVNITNQ